MDTLRIQFLLLLGLFPCLLFAQLGNPETSCIYGAGFDDIAGNIEVNWIAPTPLDDFDSYQLQRLDDVTGDFIDVGLPINDPNITLQQDNVTISDGSQCYRVLANNLDGSSTETQLLFCSIFLEYTESNPGVVDLEWNSPLPDLVTDDLEFTISVYDETLAVVDQFTVVGLNDNGPDFTYEIVGECNQTRSFLVEHNDGACSYRSNRTGSQFDDVTLSDPIISGVDVTDQGEIVVKWAIDPNEDPEGYQFYLCPGDQELYNGIGEPLNGLTEATVPLILLNAANANPTMAEVPFNTALYDVCATTGVEELHASGGFCYETIFTTTGWLPCQDEILVKWNDFNGYDPANTTYNVYHTSDALSSLDDNLFDLVASDIPSGTEDFTHSIERGLPHWYFVVASENVEGWSSRSNKVFQDTPTDNGPADLVLASASVTNDITQISLRGDLAAMDTAAYTYHLERYSEALGNFKTVSVETFQSTEEIELFDPEGDIDNKSEEYRVFVTNVCGDTVGQSNLGRTIHLEGLVNSTDLTNTLRWTPYGDWANGVEAYDIYRSLDGTYNLGDELIATVNGNELVYEDDVSAFIEGDGRFCYRVVANDGGNNLEGAITFFASSNDICIAQEPKVFVPNAIMINGFNDTFLPSIAFADRETYELFIVNRWGETIFVTRDATEAWDGKLNGRIVRQDQLIVFIRINDGVGNLVEYSGPLYVLKDERN